MRIAICDDEADQREVMLSFVRQYNPTLAVDAYDAAIDLLLAVEQIPYDIVFMDIEMPAPNGFEVAQQLKVKSNSPLVIFVTKSNSYTIQGYGVAFRYLAKPISYAMFSSVLSLALKEREPAKVSIVCDGVYRVVTVNQILYCEAMDHRLTVHTLENCFYSRMPLTEFISQLPLEDFAQPHKSYLVNQNYVQSVGSNDVVLASTQSDIPIPLSKGKRKQFIQRLGDYIGR